MAQGNLIRSVGMGSRKITGPRIRGPEKRSGQRSLFFIYTIVNRDETYIFIVIIELKMLWETIRFFTVQSLFICV